MTIAVPVRKATRVRQLKQRHPYMSDADIRNLTGYDLAQVKSAQTKREAREKPKSRA